MTFVPRESITEHVEDNTRSRQLLNDQLIAIRIEKHNNLIMSLIIRIVISVVKRAKIDSRLCVNINFKLSCYFLDYYGYVYGLSPKKKKGNRTYFDMTVQNSDGKHRLVSFNPRLYDSFQAAEKGQHAIKLSNFKRTRNIFDSSKTDLIVNEQSFVETS